MKTLAHLVVELETSSDCRTGESAIGGGLGRAGSLDG